MDQPDLARAITLRARETSVHERTRPRIKDAMRLSHWSTSDGVSPELSAALARTQTVAEHTTDPDLKADYEEAHSYLQALIDNERQANDEEDDNDW
ncbi:hypothetical protein ACIBMZ_30370 [Micromonospora sp. NPDC049900]|uniref:hypothetical protein n=1 Tax=Micromonospora sp. NPDC049900 TaxID=3364275 RepID=UPI003799A420